MNIYAPATSAASRRPVMVYLHGGAFTIGAGANYDPSRLAASQDRVVVTINFRNGALGWLAHPSFEADGDGAGGNWGLMDQQAALRWVQDNIQTFGGDPADVTLFGESSGAWSACYLMVSPHSEGLFKRVILQSGPCLEPTSLVAIASAARDGVPFAEALGCGGADAVACLRRIPAWKVARAASTRSGLNGPGSWGPVFGDAVVPIAPPQAFEEGRFTGESVIIGSNADEGRLFATGVRSLERYTAQTRWMFGADGDRVLAIYPADPDKPAYALARAFTDQRFACPSHALRRVLSRHIPVYGYEFADPRPPFVVPEWISGLEMGSYHASEVAYVFGVSWLFANTERFTVEQRELSRRMMHMWAAFGHDDAFASSWPTVSAGGGPVLIFAPQGDWVDANFHNRRRCDFWDGTSFGAVAP